MNGLKKRSILIVDRHPLTRLAVKTLLENNGLTAIGEMDDGINALHFSAQHCPDIIITDIDIVTISGIELVEKLRNNRFRGVIIVTSNKNSLFYSKQSILAGANGFLKSIDFMSNILDCLKICHSGYTYYPFAFSCEDKAPISEQHLLHSLSNQEVKVMNSLLNGLANKQIAYNMGVSDKTVSTYKKRLLLKLRCRSNFELYDFANRNKINN